MASELRVNTSTNRVGLGTITYTDTGAIVSGIVTANSFSGDIIGNITGAVTATTGSFSGDVSIAEKIIHTGDTNTFMKFDTDTISFETAGDERLRIDTNGYLSFAGDTNTYIWHPQADQLAITKGGASFPIIRFGSGGNGGTVAIGNTTQNLVTNSEILSVRGYSSFKSPTNNYAAIYTSNEGNTSGTFNAHILFNAGGANRGGFGYMPNTGELTLNHQYDITFRTGAAVLGGTERLRIQSDGKIGIGTDTVTDSNVFVEVVGNASQKARLQFDNKPTQGTNDGEIGSILFRNNADSVGYIVCKRESAVDDAYLSFGTQATGAGILERLRIKSDGDVLIGTTTSAGKFTVDSGTSNTCATFQSSDAGAGINLKDNSARSSIEQNGTLLKISSDTGGEHANSEIRLQIDGSTKVFIKSDGSMGLGSQPETDGQANSLYFANGNANMWASGNVNLYSCVNARYTGTSWKYNNTAVASYVGQQSGVWNFFNAPSGSADATATFTERFRIDENGYVTKPYTPSFAASYNGSSWSVSANTTMVFNQTRHNVGNHYNTSNGRFTAPEAGNYLFTFFSIITGNYTNAYIRMFKNGARQHGSDIHFTTNSYLGSNWDYIGYSQVFNLASGDYITMVNGGNTVTYHGNHWQQFCGYLLG